MSLLMILFLIVLVLIVFWQIGKASEYVASIKGTGDVDLKSNKFQAASWVIFGILFFVGIYYNHLYFADKMLPSPASDHGIKYEQMFFITLVLTGIVFVITHILLFYFIWKYQFSENRKAAFISHNNRLEVLWTVVPAIVMLILVAVGLINWFNMTGPAPKDAIQVEVWGKQFNWMYRYPGKDGKFGTRDWRLTNDADNQIGMIWDDKSGLDDVMPNELHLVKGIPVELIIGSRDVLHDVGIPHFRMKADAVPGVMSRMWFTPIKSTKDMIKETGNPNFVYEIACSQMCGRSHYSMRGVIIVHDTQDEFDQWMKTQQPYYLAVGPGSTKTPEVKDSTAVPVATSKDSISSTSHI